MKRITLIVAVTLLVALGSATPVAAAGGNGANKSGDFTPTNPKTTDPSNDHGNRPSDGSVGNADGKNPPGQSHKPEDKNNGYECDGNNGVGKGNPAHSACATTTTVKQTTTTTVKHGTTTTTAKPDGPPQPDKAQVANSNFEKRVTELRGTQVLGETITAPAAAEAAPADGQLAYTGMNDWLAPVGTLLVLVGFVLVRLSRRPQGAHFA